MAEIEIIYINLLIFLKVLKGKCLERQYSLVVKNLGCPDSNPAEYDLGKLQKFSLCLTFLICKVRIIIASISSS